MILAFSGWNDAAESATTAARFLATAFSAEKFAEIDPEEFYHFGLTRPHVRFKADSPTEREIIWPATEFSIAQSADLARDIIVGVAPEPHLRWKTYCASGPRASPARARLTSGPDARARSWPRSPTPGPSACRRRLRS